jgi:hypothetical protein
MTIKFASTVAALKKSWVRYLRLGTTFCPMVQDAEDSADRLIQRIQDLLTAAAEIRLQTRAKVAAARASLLQAQHAKERARTWLERALAFALRYQRPPR